MSKIKDNAYHVERLCYIQCETGNYADAKEYLYDTCYRHRMISLEDYTRIQESLCEDYLEFKNL